MKIQWTFWLFGMLSISILTTACRSEFETVRLSNDPELYYKKAMQYYDDGEWFKAQTLIESAIPFYRGRPESEEMFYRYAMTFYNMKQYILSSHWFQNFSNTYPNSVHREESDWLLAFSSYQQSPNYRLDQTESDEAVELFQTFANTYPTSDRSKECNNIIDELRAKREIKSFEEGVLYFNLRQYQAAVSSFKNTLKDYPETKNREEIEFLVVNSYFLLAENSIYGKKKERFKETIELANGFVSKYPESNRFADTQEIISTSDKRIKSLKDDQYQR